MTREQIEAWIKDGESETLGCKKTTGERRDGTQTLCAMLNHRGGRVLFGVPPDRMVIAGQQISDRTISSEAQVYISQVRILLRKLAISTHPTNSGPAINAAISGRAA